MPFRQETREIHDENGNTCKLSFEEAQKKYGLKLELAPDYIRDEFSYDVSEYFCSINRNAKSIYEHKKYIVENWPATSIGYMITFKEAQDKYGYLLEKAPDAVKIAFEYELEDEAQDITYGNSSIV